LKLGHLSGYGRNNLTSLDSTPATARPSKPEMLLLDGPAGPAAPRLGAREIHVWTADLAGAAATEGLLTPQEIQRRETIISASRASAWALARGVLRDLLGRYLDRAPQAIELAVTRSGKLYVERARNDSALPLHFNLSHSGTLAVYAFAKRSAVGVDVECSRQPPSPALLRRFTGPRAAARTAGPSADAHTDAHSMLGRWVRAEAEVKLAGGRSMGSDGQRGPAPWVASSPRGDFPVAAVAAGKRPASLWCWSWSA
jgi:4'-phosphopantetheinyl transferase